MTFTNIPTFICKDREDVTFALKFHVPRDGKDLGLEVKEVMKKLKKGVSVVVPGASRGILILIREAIEKKKNRRS